MIGTKRTSAKDVGGKQTTLLAFLQKRHPATFSTASDTVHQKVLASRFRPSVITPRQVSCSTEHHRCDADSTADALTPKLTTSQQQSTQSSDQRPGPDNDRTIVDSSNNVANSRENMRQGDSSCNVVLGCDHNAAAVDADISSGSPHITNNVRSNAKGLSDYELLRLRNIERNNARLAALGLSDPKHENPRKAPQKNRRKRAPAVPSHDLPVRRSARQRKRGPNSSSDVTEGSSTPSGASSSNNKIKPVQAPLEIAESTYTISPLIQYAMMSTDEDSARDNSWKTGEISSFLVPPVDAQTGESDTALILTPGNVRLAPPSRLGAIYSLHFFEGELGNGGNVSQQHELTSNNQWIVGAGKAGVVAMWNASANRTDDDSNQQEELNDGYSAIDPILSWKAHSGRWIAESRFLSCCSASGTPSRLLTAGNDGSVCLWDLSAVSTKDTVPKLLMQTGKELHSSGIFSLDVLKQQYDSSEVSFATASKDKTIAISTLGSRVRWWSSDHHLAKVGDVRFRGRGTSLLASVGDDSIVAIHDYRTNRIVAESSQAHARPHSVVWNPTQEHVFLTAAHDKTIKLWDVRRFGDRSSPIGVLEGHVPSQQARCKKIHRPVFYLPFHSSSRQSSFVLTGGQNSDSLSMFRCQFNILSHQNQTDCATSRLEACSVDVSLSSRGNLPGGSGGAVCIAVDGDRIAVSTDQAEVFVFQTDRTGSG